MCVCYAGGRQVTLASPFKSLLLRVQMRMTGELSCSWRATHICHADVMACLASKQSQRETHSDSMLLQGATQRSLGYTNDFAPRTQSNRWASLPHFEDLMKS